MEPRFDTHYSPDDGGYYAEFWDSLTGKDIVLNGERLMTEVYPQRYQANKAAKRIMCETNWAEAAPQAPPAAGVSTDREGKESDER